MFVQSFTQPGSGQHLRRHHESVRPPAAQSLMQGTSPSGLVFPCVARPVVSGLDQRGPLRLRGGPCLVRAPLHPALERVHMLVPI
eukprot:768549-Pyramimonas_sp.AAC.1